MFFLDAYIPQDNKSAFEIIPGLETIYKERRLKKEGQEWLAESYTPKEFDVTDPEDIKWMSHRLSPMPWHTRNQQIRISKMDAQGLPKSFMSFSKFGHSQFNSQKSKTGWDYHELVRGHDAMITAPEELSELLESVGNSD